MGLKKYKFYFDRGSIEMSASNKKDAKIMAQAEAIKRGWDYHIIERHVAHLKDIYLDLSNLTSEEKAKFRKLFSKAWARDIHEQEKSED